MSHLSIVINFFWEPFLFDLKCVKNAEINGGHKIEHLYEVMIVKKTPLLGITVCQHSTNIVMPTRDHLDRFFYPNLNTH